MKWSPVLSLWILNLSHTLCFGEMWDVIVIVEQLPEFAQGTKKKMLHHFCQRWTDNINLVCLECLLQH